MPSETAIPTEASEVPRYQLRSRRQPRYKCGTCGLRDCVCLLAVNENRRVPTGARGVPPERGENLVHRLTVRAEKTYSSLERHGDHPVDTILEKLSLPGVAKAPCPRFKEWTSDGKGLEFTLATVMPQYPAILLLAPSTSSGSLCKWSDASPLIFSVTNTEFTWIRAEYIAQHRTGGCWSLLHEWRQ